MGGVIARLRKGPTVQDELERLERDIKAAEERQRSSKVAEKRVVGSLLFYSALIYIITALVYYAYFFPPGWQERLVQLVPMALFPMVVLLLKRTVQWFYAWSTRRNAARLKRLRDEQRTRLDALKNQTMYYSTKRLLERFDPDAKRELEEIHRREKELEKELSATKEGLRKRAATQGGGPLGAPVGRGLALRPVPLPRPILAEKRSKFDKVVDYLVGDGASQRYALICQHCMCHNGMALQEEFEYIGFRCAYCNRVNPARKQRPGAAIGPPAPLPASEGVGVAQSSPGESGGGAGGADGADGADGGGGGGRCDARGESGSEGESGDDSSGSDEAAGRHSGSDRAIEDVPEADKKKD